MIDETTPQFVSFVRHARIAPQMEYRRALPPKHAPFEGD